VELVDAPAPATQELTVALHQALAALADVDRAVFLLRESAGLSYDEIAAACELSVEAVRGRLRRARSIADQRSLCACDGLSTVLDRGGVRWCSIHPPQVSFLAASLFQNRHWRIHTREEHQGR
jgi:hypothetical protein